jgi:hypothetical protein
MSDYIAGLLKEMEQFCNFLHLYKWSFININSNKQQLYSLYFIDKKTIGGMNHESKL